MTKKEMYAALKALAIAADRDDLVKGIDHEVDLLSRKSSAERKPTANQVENVKAAAFIKAHMDAGKSYTVTEVIKGVLAGSEYSDFTCSRVTAILTQMMGDEVPSVKREVVKRKAMYSLV